MTTDVIIDPNNGKIYWNSGSNDQSISIGGNASDQIFFTGYNSYYSPNSNPSPSGTDLIIFNDSASATLIPGSSGYDLGSSDYRWELFATNANYSGSIKINDTTNSITRLTGSIVTAGGIGISLNASIGGTLFFTGLGNTTHLVGLRAGAAIATTFTYTLPVRAPTGVGQSILTCDTSGNMSWISNSVYNGDQYEIPFYFSSSSGIHITGISNLKNNIVDGKVSIGYSTDSSSLVTGALQINGGIAVSRSASIGQTLRLFNGSLFTGFRSSQTGISTVYTYPPTTPSISTNSLSILNSTNSGGLSWTSFYPNITKSVTILDPQIGDKVTLFYVDSTVQISKVQTVIRGTSGIAISWQIYHGQRNSNSTLLFTNTQVTNDQADGNLHNSGFSDNTVEANKFVWVELSNVSVGSTEFHMTVFYPHS